MAILPSFWVITVILGASGDVSTVSISAWVLAVTVSIIIHELGHALTARHFGSQPEILLHSMGGLTSHGRVTSRLKDTLIIAAGPGAGFLFIGTLFVVMLATGTELHFKSSVPWVGWQPFGVTFTEKLFFYMAYINIGWGLINLFPVLPLDGGLLLKNALESFMGRKAGVTTLALSTIFAVATAGYFYYRMQSVFMLLMFGYFAVMSAQEWIKQVKRQD